MEFFFSRVYTRISVDCLLLHRIHDGNDITTMTYHSYPVGKDLYEYMR